MGKKNRQRIEELERQVAYLEAMVRHYIALQELEKATMPPNRQLPPIPAGGLNIPFPYPFGSGTTQTPLPDPPYRVTCDGTISMDVAAHEATLATAWWSPEDCEAWSDL